MLKKIISRLDRIDGRPDISARMSRCRSRVAMAAIIAAFCGEFIATHIPAAEMPAISCSDKTLHFFAYAMLGALFAICQIIRGVRLRNIMLAGVILFPLYAFFDEITQPIVNRTADYFDWRMDMIGSIGVLLISCLAAVFLGRIAKNVKNHKKRT
ncbi:MAG TPA: VanZ family protein [Phycisphaerae bacterium]|nr:VanZ family protein [Phycisphaerae bacterium]